MKENFRIRIPLFICVCVCMADPQITSDSLSFYYKVGEMP